MKTKPFYLFAMLAALCVMGSGMAAAQVLVKAPAGATVAPAEPSVPAASRNDTDQRISLDLKGIDINEFLRILSVKMGVTIVPTKSVTGRVNIFLNNLTFEDALDVVLFSQDLACEKHGKIINIMTAAEYERSYGRKYNEKRQFRSFKLAYTKPSVVFEALGQIKSDIGKIIVDETSGAIFLIDIPEKLDLMAATILKLDKPPIVEIFELRYSKPADVKAQLAAVVTQGIGSVYVDERSHKIVVSDLPEKMKKIREMIQAFDEPTRQVFIEGEIVQVTLKNEYLRGIDWQKIMGGALNNMNISGTFPVASSFTASPNLGTDQLKMSVGTLASDKYTAAVQFLETLGDTKILSQPRIAVTNNQEANIMVGSREAYVTQSLSQGQNTTVTSENIQFTDVGVKLKVEPSISDDGYVVLKIKPEVSSVREVITTALGSRIPIVETSQAETVVKVKDGTMIMIAGLMKEEKREDTTGVPVLSKIPFIGAAFGAKAKQKKKTELIIFITPRIIAGNTPVPGLEADHIVPPDIASKPLRDKIIREGLDLIKKDAPERRSRSLERQSADIPAEEDADDDGAEPRMKELKTF